jgi:hypothetical protein
MWWLIGAGSMWFLLGFTLYFANFHGALAQKSSEWNDFGVFIAGFSGTGVAVITLIALANGIRVQAEDLAKSRSFMAKQSATMAQQAFDSVFFNLLDRFSQVRDSVSVAIYMPKRVDGGSVPDMQTAFVTGRQAFAEFYRCLKSAQVGMQKTVPNRMTVLRNNFMGQYKLVESELGPYFRTLYRIFAFIDGSTTLTQEQKMEYAKIARAQLSDLELCVIFYDGFTEMASKFKPLIERYGLLRHVNAGNLILEDDKTNPLLYDATAFLPQPLLHRYPVEGS